MLYPLPSLHLPVMLFSFSYDYHWYCHVFTYPTFLAPLSRISFLHRKHIGAFSWSVSNECWSACFNPIQPGRIQCNIRYPAYILPSRTQTQLVKVRLADGYSMCCLPRSQRAKNIALQWCFLKLPPRKKSFS